MQLASVSCERLRFCAGDRVLVKVWGPLSKKAAAKIRSSIIKWAGVSVEVFIYNAHQMEIKVEHAQEEHK